MPMGVRAGAMPVPVLLEGAGWQDGRWVLLEQCHSFEIVPSPTKPPFGTRVWLWGSLEVAEPYRIHVPGYRSEEREASSSGSSGGGTPWPVSSTAAKR